MNWKTFASLSAAIGVVALAGAALAKPMSFNGAWSGEYTCAQGLTGLTVDLRERRSGKVDAIVTFYEHPKNLGVPSGCFTASGMVSHETGRVTLEPGQWIVRPGPFWSMVTIDGQVNASGDRYTGRMVFAPSPSDCTTFTLKRGAKPFRAPPKACMMPQAIS